MSLATKINRNITNNKVKTLHYKQQSKVLNDAKLNRCLALQSFQA